MKDNEEILAELTSLVGEELRVSFALHRNVKLLRHRAVQGHSSPRCWSNIQGISILGGAFTSLPPGNRLPLKQALSLQSVSYKWLAREYELPVNLAKQLLFRFADEHRRKVNITYLLAGWTKEPSRQHTFQLVDGSRLQVMTACPCMFSWDSKQMGRKLHQMLFRYCMFHALVHMCLISAQESRKQLDPITSLHVYSVQPSQPQVRTLAICGASQMT